MSSRVFSFNWECTLIKFRNFHVLEWVFANEFLTRINKIVLWLISILLDIIRGKTIDMIKHSDI